MKYALVLVILAVFAVGCVQLPGFGTDVININPSTSAQGTEDILVVKNVELSPHSPVLTDTVVLLSFVIENTDLSSSVKSIEKIDVNLFDPSIFTIKSGAATVKIETMLPGEQRYVDFNLKSPSESVVGSIEQKETALSFKTNYEYATETTLSVPVVSMKEIQSMQRAGKTVSINSPKYFSSGPVRADIELSGQSYILSGDVLSHDDYTGTFIVTLKNVGSGFLKDNVIPENRIKIEFPFDVTSFPGGTGDNRFNCAGKTCTNAGKIDFYRDQSIPFRFTMQPQPLPITEPYRTYQVKIVTNYIYELRNTVPVTVMPPQR